MSLPMGAHLLDAGQIPGPKDLIGRADHGKSAPRARASDRIAIGRGLAGVWPGFAAALLAALIFSGLIVRPARMGANAPERVGRGTHAAAPSLRTAGFEHPSRRRGWVPIASCSRVHHIAVGHVASGCVACCHGAIRSTPVATEAIAVDHHFAGEVLRPTADGRA